MHVTRASLTATQLSENDAIVRAEDARIGIGCSLHNRSRQQRRARPLHEGPPIHFLSPSLSTKSLPLCGALTRISPSLYQPSESRPAIAKRTAGRPLRGSSMPTLKS